MKRLAALTVLSVIVSFVAAIVTTRAASAQDAQEIARALAGENCPGCNLFQADLSYRDLPRLNLSGARLRQADLSLSTMNDTNFSGANLSVANAFGGRFSSADFAAADLSDAVFVGAYLGHANFDGAVLTGANFAGAEFEGARNLTQAQLDAACGDQRTRLPAGLAIAPCG